MIWFFLSIALITAGKPLNETFIVTESGRIISVRNRHDISNNNNNNNNNNMTVVVESWKNASFAEQADLPLFTIVTISSYVILIITTVTGNCLVIAAFFKEPALQAITNYWIVSLSLTDIILASTVMPLQVKRELYLDKWILGEFACDIFICLDVLCCSCSIYHLGLISLDRYFCIRFPIRYTALRSTEKTILAIFLTWVWCTGISVPRMFGWKNPVVEANSESCQMTNKSYMLFSSFLSFYIPLFLTACMYIGIYRLTRQRTRRFRRELAATVRYRNQCSQQQQGQNLLPQNTPGGVANSSATTTATTLSTTNCRPVITEDRPSAHLTAHLTVLSNIPPDISVALSGLKASDESTTGLDPGDHLEVLEETEIEDLSPNLPSETRNEQQVFQLLRSRISAVIPQSFRFTRSRTAVSLPGRPNRRTSHQSTSTPPQHRLQDRRSSSSRELKKLCITNSDTNLAAAARSKTQGAGSGSAAARAGGVSPQIARLHRFRGSDYQRRKKTIAQAKLTRRRQKQEVRAARVVVIVFGAFVVFWMPFFLVNTIAPLCGSCRITRAVWKWVTFWGYVNSSVNPFIYTFFNRTFRRAILSVLKCERRRH